MIQSMKHPHHGRVLLVDDDPAILQTFRMCLEDADFRVATAASAAQADRLVQEQVFDVCFLDLRLGDDSGLDLLRRIRQQAPWMRVVMVTASASIGSAVDAMRLGAVDYLVKPCSAEQIRVAASKQFDARRMELRIEALESEQPPPIEMDSASAPMRAMLATAEQVAKTDATILILGETGAGKGVLAKAIHARSRRAEAPFVTINCPSLSAELLESELFGHKRGAFTGATENRLGRVDQAEGGSLFLDEVGDVPLPLQAKLLRFVQDREYERVGDPQTRRADVRIIAATNHDLGAMVEQGRFRGDLLYRLDVISLVVPPLRERPEDIGALAERLLARFVGMHGRPARHFSQAARDALLAYPWPGNVRELANVIERASILCNTAEIDLAQLSIPATAGEQRTEVPRVGDKLAIESLERAHIALVVAASPTLDAAARTLGIDSSTLYRKRKQYGLD
jgi:NtrC-family two-component system response regulator AlgB